MKDSVSRASFESTGLEVENETNYDDMTPSCDLCGEENVGMGTPVLMMIPGMLFPSQEYDVPVFVPDPDAKLRTLQFPNGMIGFVTDAEKTKYAHADCYQELVDHAAYVEELEAEAEEQTEGDEG